MNIDKKMKTAVEFHDSIVQTFNENYNKKQSFKDRYKIWTNIFDKYIVTNNLNINIKILDAGCGTGIFSFYLAEKGCKVIGIDGSEKMIDFCNSKAKKLKIKNISFMKKIFPLNNECSSFDAIISSSVLEYIPNYNKVIDNFFEILKPNGVLVVSLPNERSYYRLIEKLIYMIIQKPSYLKHVNNSFSLNEFSKVLNRKGFSILESNYYGEKSNIFFKMINSLLPKKYSNNLFIIVCNKRT